MDIKHMEYFAMLAKEKSFSKASEILGISQPTLTQAVQKLERTLGAPLFDRSFSELTLSEEGSVFLESCLKIGDIFDQTTKQITELTKGISGKVRIGIAPFRAQYAVSGWLGRFHDRYPNVVLALDELLTEDLFPALDKGELDLALTASEKRPGSKYESIPLAAEEVLVAVHKDIAAANPLLPAASPEGGLSEVDFSAFDGTDFVLLSDEQLLGRKFRALSRESRVSPRSVTRCTSIETSLALADAGAGAALTLSSGLRYYKDRFPNLRYYSVRSEAPKRVVYVIYRRNQYLSNPARYAIQLLEDEHLDTRD